MRSHDCGALGQLAIVAVICATQALPSARGDRYFWIL